MDEKLANQAFLDNHSPRFLEMAFDFSRHEKVFRPDGYGKQMSDCGDKIEISLTTMKKVIQHVSLGIEGCANINACANAVAFLAEGKTIDEAWKISPKQVANYLETLPEKSFHCAEMAIKALLQAIIDFRRKPVTNH